jgi:signal transduction histidine kinase
VIDQDRAVERDRQHERLEHAAGAIANAIQLQMLRGDVRVRIEGGRVAVNPPGGLVYIPEAFEEEPVPAAMFTAAEAVEFSANPAGAVPLYLDVAHNSSFPTVRAEALVRAARVLRSLKRWAEAVAVYRQLEQLQTVSVAGMPSGLIARGGFCSVLAASSGQTAELRQAAAVLRQDLLAGRWPVTRETLHTYLDETSQWIGSGELPADWKERVATAEAVAQIWNRERTEAAGKRFVALDGLPVSIAWERRSGGGEWSAVMTGPVTWRTLWKQLEEQNKVQLQLSSLEGERLWGVNMTTGGQRYSAVGLPLHLTVAPGGSESDVGLQPARRSLLLAGFATFAVLLLGGAFFIARAMNRELAVARLQADFVAAVSHEFRTPLTSIRQLTELLAKGRMKSPDQAQRAYELMLSESERLKRLVESILDFGRMQSGAYQFRFEPTPADEWVRQVVRDFQNATGESGVSVEASGSSNEATAMLDREAMRGALWNLLDNAVKYSPDEKRVEVEIREDVAALAIRVRDHGMGIARADLRHIFDRFYRGESAKSAGAKGTGIGLALVKEIVEAHGGTVFAESSPGEGSTFTIRLPRERTA